MYNVSRHKGFLFKHSSVRLFTSLLINACQFAFFNLPPSLWGWIWTVGSKTALLISTVRFNDDPEYKNPSSSLFFLYSSKELSDFQTSRNLPTFLPSSFLLTSEALSGYSFVLPNRTSTKLTVSDQFFIFLTVFTVSLAMHVVPHFFHPYFRLLYAQTCVFALARKF